MMTKGEETRAAILDRAVDVASELGLEGLSIGGLAKDVGMSKSGLFAHFDSKENLQLQVLASAAERFAEAVIKPAITRPRGEPRVRALFDGWLRWAKKRSGPGGCVFISAASELDDRPGPLRDYLAESQREWLGVLARAARLAIEEGHFRADLDVEQLAYDIYAIVLAQHHFQRLLDDPRAEERSRHAFDRLIDEARAEPA